MMTENMNNTVVENTAAENSVENAVAENPAENNTSAPAKGVRALCGNIEFTEKTYETFSDDDRYMIQVAIDDAIADCIEEMTLFHDIDIDIMVYGNDEPEVLETKEFLKIEKPKYTDRPGAADALIRGNLMVDLQRLANSTLMLEEGRFMELNNDEELDKKIKRLLKESRRFQARK